MHESSCLFSRNGNLVSKKNVLNINDRKTERNPKENPCFPKKRKKYRFEKKTGVKCDELFFKGFKNHHHRKKSPDDSTPRRKKTGVKDELDDLAELGVDFASDSEERSRSRWPGVDSDSHSDFSHVSKRRGGHKCL